LLLEDQNQKYSPGSEQKRRISARFGAKRANPKDLASRLPAFLLIPIDRSIDKAEACRAAKPSAVT